MELIAVIALAVIVYLSHKRATRKITNDIVMPIQDIKPEHVEKPKPVINEKRTDISEIELSDEQKKLFERAENSTDNIFITGKSVLLQYLKNHSSKRLVVCAPTGVAALNVRGQTIHSLFKLPPRFIAPESVPSIAMPTFGRLVD